MAAEPSLRALAEFHRDATVACAATGDDWGNLTTFDAALQRGGVNGMNRLNHCPAIFFEAMRTGDHQLQQTALAWCDNYYDLSIWWGPEGMGGTRYNNVRAATRRRRTTIARSCGDRTTRSIFARKGFPHCCSPTRKRAIRA